MMCCSLRSHCANSVYVALFFSLDLLSEPVFVGEVVSGPQDSVLWCGTLHVLYTDRSWSPGLPFSGLFLEGKCIMKKK